MRRHGDVDAVPHAVRHHAVVLEQLEAAGEARPIRVGHRRRELHPQRTNAQLAARVPHEGARDRRAEIRHVDVRLAQAVQKAGA